MKHDSKDVQHIFLKNLASVGIMLAFIRLLISTITVAKAKGISSLMISATESDVRNTTFSAVILLAVLLLGYAANTILSVIKNKQLLRKMHICRISIIEKLFANKLSNVSGFRTGVLLENVKDDLDKSVNFFANTLPTLLCGIAQIGLYLCFLYILDQTICFVLLFIALLQMISPIIVTKFMEKHYGETREIESRITDEIIQAYSGLAEIRHNHAENWAIKRFKELNDLAFKIDTKNQMLLQSENAMDNMITSLMTYGTYAILGFLTLNGTVPLSISLQATVVSASFYETVKGVFDAFQERGVANVATKRLNEAIYNEGQIGTFAERVNELRFDNFSVKTNDANSALFSNLHLSIPLTDKVIITGENGTGKSTMIKYIVGVLNAEAGTISFCGMNPAQWSDTQRNSHVFYLPQTLPGFKITAQQLYDCYFQKAKDSVSIAQSLAERFKLRKDIWNTSIYDMSGGERQKVFLALAFSTPDNVTLLLDEPTNSLDREGIELFISLLRTRLGGAIVVSHDPEVTALPYSKYRLTKGVIVHEESIS